MLLSNSLPLHYKSKPKQRFPFHINKYLHLCLQLWEGREKKRCKICPKDFSCMWFTCKLTSERPGSNYAQWQLEFWKVTLRSTCKLIWRENASEIQTTKRTILSWQRILMAAGSSSSVQRCFQLQKRLKISNVSHFYCNPRMVVEKNGIELPKLTTWMCFKVKKKRRNFELNSKT